MDGSWYPALIKRISKPDRRSIRIFAYEVDGRGSAELMDDANVPRYFILNDLIFESHRLVFALKVYWGCPTWGQCLLIMRFTSEHDNSSSQQIIRTS